MKITRTFNPNVDKGGGYGNYEIFRVVHIGLRRACSKCPNDDKHGPYREFRKNSDDRVNNLFYSADFRKCSFLTTRELILPMFKVWSLAEE